MWSVLWYTIIQMCWHVFTTWPHRSTSVSRTPHTILVPSPAPLSGLSRCNPTRPSPWTSAGSEAGHKHCQVKKWQHVPPNDLEGPWAEGCVRYLIRQICWHPHSWAGDPGVDQQLNCSTELVCLWSANGSEQVSPFSHQSGKYRWTSLEPISPELFPDPSSAVSNTPLFHRFG